MKKIIKKYKKKISNSLLNSLILILLLALVSFLLSFFTPYFNTGNIKNVSSGHIFKEESVVSKSNILENQIKNKQAGLDIYLSNDDIVYADSISVGIKNLLSEFFKESSKNKGDYYFLLNKFNIQQKRIEKYKKEKQNKIRKIGQVIPFNTNGIESMCKEDRQEYPINVSNDNLSYFTRKWRTKNIIEEGKYSDICLKAPIFKGEDVKKLNVNTISSLFNVIHQEEKEVEPDIIANKQICDWPGYIYFCSVNLKSNYTVHYSTKNLISVEFVLSDLTGAGTGCHDFPVNINYNVSKKKYITFDNLFCSHDYLDKITSLIRKKLILENIPVSQGVLNDSNNTLKTNIKESDFYFAKDGLVFTFDPYSIAVGPQKILKVKINYKYLEKYFCSDYKKLIKDDN